MKNKSIDNIYIFIIIFFTVSCVISWNLYFKVYQQKDTVSIHTFPRQVAEWNSKEIPITEKEKAILETDNVFARSYTNPKGEEVYLFIVYSQNNRKVSHPPEVCYTGSGATILNNVHDSFHTESTIKDIDVNRVTVEQGHENQVFFYWFKVGDAFTPNYWKQQILIALKTFRGQPSSSALIRISTSSNNREVEDQEAITRLKDFGRIIFPLIQKHLP